MMMDDNSGNNTLNDLFFIIGIKEYEIQRMRTLLEQKQRQIVELTAKLGRHEKKRNQAEGENIDA